MGKGISVASRKEKARRLQKEMVEEILKLFPEQLTDRDVRSVPMGVSGVDVVLSEEAFKLFPFAVECKNTERLSIWKELKQAEDNAREGTPILVFSRNYTPTYVALRLEDFIELFKKTL